MTVALTYRSSFAVFERACSARVSSNRGHRRLRGPASIASSEEDDDVLITIGCSACAPGQGFNISPTLLCAELKQGPSFVLAWFGGANDVLTTALLGGARSLCFSNQRLAAAAQTWSSRCDAFRHSVRQALVPQATHLHLATRTTVRALSHVAHPAGGRTCTRACHRMMNVIHASERGARIRRVDRPAALGCSCGDAD